MKVLFIVSTLKATGPTTQLYNLISNLDRSRFEPCVLTLSPEPADSRWKAFAALEVELLSLNLSRIQGIWKAKHGLRKVIDVLAPDIIHTQGIRADGLMSRSKSGIPWVMTARNFPPADYPTKFGKVKGGMMVKQHFSIMKRCKHLVTCSETIQKQFADVGISGQAIQNGVNLSATTGADGSVLKEYAKPIYVSVGSLIPRKNMSFIIKAFSSLPEKQRGSLVILGDGPQKEQLESLRVKGVILPGNVSNVADYLAGADYFVSASLSEGLPNTVLEALASGLPAILSNIQSHQEIADVASRACKLFSLSEGTTALQRAMLEAPRDFDDESREDAKNSAYDNFSAQKMSMHYQDLYNSIVVGEK
ncbi:glycosyltransferase [Idiomarina xiamenensis]|uniref:Group 1 glycosyl transferase n=1 Tax=Idiomarina xiamenensis 10-D-4 TaxID=740709 RepID=K2JNZ7_9GAMM|nr:glycosyltransferase [Idiomarina xiamenensis]EKE85196.1 group 1 glycosyl transferase [Idiomarina xiamenensis 10-D-4]